MYMSTTKGITYLLFGAVAGAIGGLLLAPKKGTETRKQVNKWLKEKKELGTEKFNELREHMPEHKERIMKALNDGKEKTVKVLHDGKEIFHKNGRKKKTPVEA